MAITWDDVEDIAPELASLSEDAQTIILNYVNQALAVVEFGGEGSATLRLARIYMAAHYGTVTARGGTGPAGPVTSESAGGLSRSYGLVTSGGSGDEMATTGYGQAYMSLVRRSPARAGVAL